MDDDLKTIIAGGVGLLGIFAFMCALVVLPWGVLYL